MSWTSGDVSESTTLTDNDHLYPVLFNELRESRAATAVVGRTSVCEYYCDGTADDIQIQAAIDAVNTAGGGIVFIKGGSYSLTATLTMYDDICLIGEGRETKLTTSGNISAITASSKSRMGVKDLFLYGNGGTSTSNRGIFFTTCTYSRIENVDIENFGGYGIYFYNGCDYNIMTNNFFKDNVTFTVFLELSCEHNVLSNNTFKDNCAGSNVVVIYYRNNCHHNVIANNNLYNSTSTLNIGIGLYTNPGYDDGCYYCSVTGNVIEGFTYGIYVNGTESVTITGNVCQNGNGYGINLDDVNYSTVSGNIIEGNDSVGITLTGPTEARRSSFNTISGNVCRNNVRDGILLYGAINNLVIGNVLESNDSGNTGTYCGIQVALNSDNNIIAFNRCAENDKYEISIAGATENNNVVFGNYVVGTDHVGTIYNAGTGTVIRQNYGYVTEASGTGSIASGATSATITHGLAVTPTVDDISITGAENPTNDVGTIWVDTLGATTFKVNVENDPGASNFDFGWRAQVL